MKINLFLILLWLAASSCSSLPGGKKTLKPMFAGEAKPNGNTYHQGRPIYVKAVIYKHFAEDGNIVDDHFIYLNMGRERLSLKELIHAK